MKPSFVVLGIFAAWLFACSSVFAADTESPRPYSAPGGETVRELQNVTQGKSQKAKPKVRKARVQRKQPRFNPEDVGC